MPYFLLKDSDILPQKELHWSPLGSYNPLIRPPGRLSEVVVWLTSKYSDKQEVALLIDIGLAAITESPMLADIGGGAVQARPRGASCTILAAGSPSRFSIFAPLVSTKMMASLETPLLPQKSGA